MVVRKNVFYDILEVDEDVDEDHTRKRSYVYAILALFYMM